MNTGFWLVSRGHVTLILASDWSMSCSVTDARQLGRCKVFAWICKWPNSSCLRTSLSFSNGLQHPTWLFIDAQVQLFVEITSMTCESVKYQYFVAWYLISQSYNVDAPYCPTLLNETEKMNCPTLMLPADFLSIVADFVYFIQMSAS